MTGLLWDDVGVARHGRHLEWLWRLLIEDFGWKVGLSQASASTVCICTDHADEKGTSLWVIHLYICIHVAYSLGREYENMYRMIHKWKSIDASSTGWARRRQRYLDLLYGNEFCQSKRNMARLCPSRSAVELGAETGQVQQTFVDRPVRSKQLEAMSSL